LRRPDMLIHIPQACGRQRNATGSTRQRTRVRARDLRIVDHDHGVVRGILNHIERYIAEVPFITDSVTGSKRRLAIAEYIERKPDTRRHGAVLRLPQPADRTLRSGKYLPAPNALDVAPRAIVEVGVQIRMVVVLNAIVLIAQTIVQREPR